MACREATRWGYLTYERCEELTQGGARQRRLAPNTYLLRDADRSYVVILYGTAIIRYAEDGAVILSHGGYATSTTRGRINALSGYAVYQQKWEWYVGRQRFYDGINVGAPRTEREAIEQDVRRGNVPASVLADYDTDTER